VKKFVFACLVTAALAPGASAATSGCVSLADPANDAVVPALDLLSTDLVASGDAVSVVFSLNGAPDALPGLSYSYAVEFEDATAVYTLEAAVGGVSTPANAPYELLIGVKSAPDPETGAVTIGSQSKVAVSGSVDVAAKTVTVTAPASAFGVASFPAGRTWTVGLAQTGFSVGGVVRPHGVDEANGNGAALVAGDGTCA
jgi:hypothetical protein